MGAQARRPVTLARGLAAAPVIALLALVPATAAGKPAKKSASAKSAAKPQCGPDMGTLYPQAPGAERFTMVIRINTSKDVDVYANANEFAGGLKPRIRNRDIFLINTRFKDTDARTEQQIASELRAAFPCNRIYALNGLAYNAYSEGYMFSLLNAPEVSALLIDWEKLDWDVARASDSGTPPWVDSPFRSMLPRLKNRLSVLANGVRASGTGKRIGLVPFARSDWNLGVMARTVDRQARRIVPGGRGFQSSQTQKSCQSDGGAGMQATTKTLFTQYKHANFKRVKRGKGKKPKVRRLKPRTNKFNLGVQVSFTSTPNPSHPDPVKSVGAERAAECTTSAIYQKAGAILYWARPQDMDALFADPRVCALRPSPFGVC
jgi:hypothetical protein